MSKKEEDLSNVALKNNNVNFDSLIKIAGIDLMIVSYYFGQLDFAKKVNLHKLFEEEKFEDAKITTLGIIDDFAVKFNIDYGNISQRTLYNKLYKMIHHIDKDFLNC